MPSVKRGGRGRNQIPYYRIKHGNRDIYEQFPTKQAAEIFKKTHEKEKDGDGNYKYPKGLKVVPPND